MNTDVFKYIVYSSRYGSFSIAAKKLYVTHSTISTAISKFEKELGIMIFKRSNKGVSLTTQGKYILQLSENILSDLEKMEFFSKKQSQERIIVSSIATLSNNVLTNAVQAFGKSHPYARIISNEIYPHLVVASIIEQEGNLGISFIQTKNIASFKNQYKNDPLIFEPLYEDKLVLFANKNNILTKKLHVAEKDLKDMLLVSINHRHQKETFDTYKNYVDDDYKYSFSNQESVKKMIAENVNAVAYLPHILTYNDYYVKNNAIVPVDVVDKQETLVYFVVYRTDTPHRDIIISLIDTIEKVLYDMIAECNESHPLN